MLGGEDDLVGGLAAAALAAHAVGDDAEHATALSGMGDDLDLILLVQTIAAMDAGGGAEAIAWGVATHPKTIIVRLGFPVGWFPVYG